MKALFGTASSSILAMTAAEIFNPHQADTVNLGDTATVYSVDPDNAAMVNVVNLSNVTGVYTVDPDDTAAVDPDNTAAEISYNKTRPRPLPVQSKYPVPDNQQPCTSEVFNSPQWL